MPSSPSSDAEIRVARADDLPAILALLADDDLGRRREAPDDSRAAYARAFAAIAADPANEILVAVVAGRVVGCLQLTLIPGLTRKGATRAQIEAVRVAADRRGAGLGAALMRAAIERARARGAALAQLTSDARRPDAHRFYERLGFAPSHVGFKLDLAPRA
ncbi:MAG: GNAT family N-acetyltransferase [Methylobacteriaceae bacterium]|nr:GNAT family N-acetyltransferase [Methylobacteriaceae bacterium]